GGVNFDSNDRYCIDGQRLIAVKGVNGANLTEYRVKKNGYDKVVSFGRSGDSGPEYFKVWRTDGSVYEYGVTADSRVELPEQSHVYKWALNKVTDLSKNNHIDYFYKEGVNTGSHQLSSISYVGGKVSFEYEARPDKTFQYLYGSKLSRIERLERVVIHDADLNELGSYDLNYDESRITKRSLLQDIRYCTEDGACSTKVLFSWNHNYPKEFFIASTFRNT
ncbi:SpvB/TcaC N-terminal domain-containing protein, partial [Vibrio alginolyticus]